MPGARVATFNISGALESDKRFYSMSGLGDSRVRARQSRERIEQIAEVLASHSLDLIALQEVDVCFAAEDTLWQADELAKLLGMHAVWQPLFDYRVGSIVNVSTGLCTLSRTPPSSIRQWKAPARTTASRLRQRWLGKKGALLTTHELDGRLWLMCNAHLDHEDAVSRRLEIEGLTQQVQEPGLLMGDLNTTPASTRHPSMVEAHLFRFDACERVLQRSGFRGDRRLESSTFLPEELLSFPDGAPSLKLDYILAKGDDIEIHEEAVDTGLSNHRLCVGQLAW